MLLRVFLACLVSALISTAHAEPGDEEKEYVPQRKYQEVKVGPAEKPPLALRLIMQPISRGMWLRLPIVDTDPNRGITGGFMPIWVLKEDGKDRIEQIHAPSLTYNRYFKWIPTYRYYYYPASDSTLMTRASVGKYEHEVLAQYENQTMLDIPRDIDVFLRFQWNVDSGQRFFGLGPDTPQNAESNYKQDYIETRFVVGTPVLPDSNWRLKVGDHYITSQVSNGPVPGLQGFETIHPEARSPGHIQSNEIRALAEYDTRDHTVTTSRGRFLQLYAQKAIDGVASSYDFSRYGVDSRIFVPVPGHEERSVSALQAKFEQVYGSAPFWVLPRIGGKYNLRAYGEGRYIDRGTMTLNFEQRFTVWKAPLAGVVTEFEVSPFAGLGSVFNTPEKIAAKLVRPVMGVATRAVARPQVVGSIDFGMGQEGLAVFMDINYSF
jgi:hypothetical protein